MHPGADSFRDADETTNFSNPHVYLAEELSSQMLLSTLSRGIAIVCLLNFIIIIIIIIVIKIGYLLATIKNKTFKIK